MEHSKRIVWLDVTRTVAIFLVVFNHVVQLMYKFDLEGWSFYSTRMNLIKLALFSIGRLGVPLFLSISGVLLLNKKMENDEDVLHFYRHNLLPLFLATEIWNVLYLLFRHLDGEMLTLKNVVDSLLFLDRNTIRDTDSMWYMPVILGVYLAVPYLSKLLNQFPKAIQLTMLFSFGFCVLLPSINVITRGAGRSIYASSIDVYFLGSAYGLLLLCGYFIGKGILRSVPLWGLFAGIFIGYSSAVAVQFFAFSHGYAYKVWYNWIGIFLAGLLLFEVFRRMENIPLPKKLIGACRFVSRKSLAIYFLHMPVLALLLDFIERYEFSRILKVFGCWAMVVAACLAIITVLGNIKAIRKIVFLEK